MLLTLIATLTLGVAAGAALGYAAAAHRETEKREACQQLAQELLTIQSQAQEGDRDPLLVRIGGESDCFPPHD